MARRQHRLEQHAGPAEPVARIGEPIYMRPLDDEGRV
jgi:hypothetical protein